jgi:hypothetical protein
LVQTGVDDFKSVITECTRDGLCPAVVAVKSGLGNDNAIGPLHK